MQNLVILIAPCAPGTGVAGAARSAAAAVMRRGEPDRVHSHDRDDDGFDRDRNAR